MFGTDRLASSLHFSVLLLSPPLTPPLPSLEQPRAVFGRYWEQYLKWPDGDPLPGFEEIRAKSHPESPKAAAKSKSSKPTGAAASSRVKVEKTNSKSKSKSELAPASGPVATPSSGSKVTMRGTRAGAASTTSIEVGGSDAQPVEEKDVVIGDAADLDLKSVPIPKFAAVDEVLRAKHRAADETARGGQERRQAEMEKEEKEKKKTKKLNSIVEPSSSSASKSSSLLSQAEPTPTNMEPPNTAAEKESVSISAQTASGHAGGAEAEYGDEQPTQSWWVRNRQIVLVGAIGYMVVASIYAIYLFIYGER